MFGINRLKEKVKHLEEAIEEQRASIWKLGNPPKFKKGDVVYSQAHTRRFICYGELRVVSRRLITTGVMYAPYRWKYQLIHNCTDVINEWESNLSL